MKKWNNGYNTILTGQAGSGKSWTVENEIIEKYGKYCKIALTGMTGLASCNIKGQTIHSWLHLGMIEYDKGLEYNVDRVFYGTKREKWQNVKNTDVLVIDEISMCDAFVFELIDNVLKTVRRNDMPFGSIQMILVGDCYQLPPVKKDKYGYYFQSKAYKEGNFKAVVLKQQHRQNSGHFLDVLNRIRVGKHTHEDIDYLNTRSYQNLGNIDLPDDTVYLFSTNEEVKDANSKYFNALNGFPEYYYSNDERLIPVKKKNGIVIDDKLDTNIRAPKILELKKGCTVLLLSNLDVANGIVNGSKGFFIEKQYDDTLLCKFNGIYKNIKKQKFEVYKDDELVFVREQYPLILGHSITSHKAQGMTLKNVYIDFRKFFAPHQAYVALSRVKELEGLYIVGLNYNTVKVDAQVIEYMEGLEK